MKQLRRSLRPGLLPGCLCAAVLAASCGASAPETAAPAAPRTVLAAAAIPAAPSPGDVLRARLASVPSGATLQVPAGIYEGTFVIDRPLHLIGSPGAVLRGNGKGNVLALRADDIEVAGFVIRGSGRALGDDAAALHVTGSRALIRGNRILDMLHGIYVRKANDCRILDNVILGDGAAGDDAVADPVLSGLKAADAADAELCMIESSQDTRGNGIHLWNSSGHLISGNRIRGVRDGIYFSFTSRTEVRRNDIRHVRYGLHYMYSNDNVFSENVFSDNAAGAALMYSKNLILQENRFIANRSHRAYGLLLQSIDDTRVERNTIEGNTLGLFIENGNNNVFQANRIAGNYVGLRLTDSSAHCTFSENLFVHNLHAVETNGTSTANDWTAEGRGNTWDGALALDLNHDGISDLPHREPDLFGAWRRDFPAIGLLSASPGERLLHFIHSRLALTSLPGVTDPKPVLRTLAVRKSVKPVPGAGELLP